MYVTIDDLSNTYIPFDEEREQAYDIAEKLGLPLVVLQAGKPYRAVYDRKTRRLTAGDPVPVEELQQPVHIDNVKKQQMAAEIFENSPFKPRTPEYDYVDARDQGRIAYLDIVLASGDQSLESPIHIVTLDGKTVDYTVENGNIVRTNTQFDRMANENIPRSSAIKRDRDDTVRRNEVYANITRYSTAEIGDGEAFRNPEKYLEHLATTMASYKEKSEHDETEQSRNFWAEYLPLMACHVYGLASEAATRGDTAIADQANALANKYFSVETIQDVMQRRVNDQGGFRTTEADFPELQKKKKR